MHSAYICKQNKTIIIKWKNIIVQKEKKTFKIISCTIA